MNSHRLDARKGSVTVIFLLLLLAVVGVGAMAVDFALIQSARTDLRVSCDLASRAAMVDYIETKSVSSARARAKDIASRNPVIRANLQLEDVDITPGNSAPGQGSRYEFTANQLPFNSFRVEANLLNGSSSGNLPTVFSNVHNVTSVEIDQRATATETYLDVVLVLDRSGSMAFDLTGVEWSYPSGNSWYIDYYVAPRQGSRWKSLENAISVFLQEMSVKSKKEHVALVTYSSTENYYSQYWKKYFSSNEVQTDRNFTTDYTKIMSSVTTIGSKPVIGGTAISSGIDRAITLLNNSPRASYSDRIIVLLTDGDWNVGYDPVVAAQTAAANRISIHTIAFGSGAGSQVMAQVAAATGGTAFDAPGDTELAEAFRDIARSIGLSYTE